MRTNSVVRHMEMNVTKGRNVKQVAISQNNSDEHSFEAKVSE